MNLNATLMKVQLVSSKSEPESESALEYSNQLRILKASIYSPVNFTYNTQNLFTSLNYSMPHKRAKRSVREQMRSDKCVYMFFGTKKV